MQKIKKEIPMAWINFYWGASRTLEHMEIIFDNLYTNFSPTWAEILRSMIEYIPTIQGQFSLNSKYLPIAEKGHFEKMRMEISMLTHEIRPEFSEIMLSRLNSDFYPRKDFDANGNEISIRDEILQDLREEIPQLISEGISECEQMNCEQPGNPFDPEINLLTNIQNSPLIEEKEILKRLDNFDPEHNKLLNCSNELRATLQKILSRSEGN